MLAESTAVRALPDQEYNQQRRSNLRRLDDCLNLLEEAHEGGFVEVTEQMAGALQTRVPRITPGMTIAAAIEEVLMQQEPYMLHPAPATQERRQAPARRFHSYDIARILGAPEGGASEGVDEEMIARKTRNRMR